MVFGWRRRERFDEYDDHYLYLRHRNRRHATFTGFCLFTAFILFLFIALSLPIIKTVYLLQINGHPSPSLPETSVGTELRFGVWGFCVTSQLDQPTFFNNNGECVGPQLGYTIDPQIIAVVTNEPALANLILKALTILLVLHPIAAGLAFLTLIPVIASCCVFHTAPWIISLVLSVATAIMSTIVFAADLALVLVARHKLRDQHTVNVTISFGNGVWIVLVSTIFTWVAMILLAARVCYCCGFGRSYEIDNEEMEGPESGEK
ncbi:SUR7/PalI family-domain-containing protein [Russula emetica]|nr:SUR7/PalI family-domain-containing protein [Russula emetica]